MVRLICFFPHQAIFSIDVSKHTSSRFDQRDLICRSWTGTDVYPDPTHNLASA